MSAQLLHYRSWQGRLRKPLWSIWPIARVALSGLFRRRVFWLLYSVGLLLFFMFFFGSYLLDWAETMLPAGNIQIGKIAPEPDRVAKMLRNGLRILNGSQETFLTFFIYQGTMVMVVLALAGAILVGNDHTNRSVPFYLAKPIHSRHYILGKCLAVGVVVNMLTTLPALVLFLQHGMGEWQYLVNPHYFTETNTGKGPASWPLLLGILQYGLILTVFLSVVLVALASWVRRTMPLIMVWTALFMFVRLLAGVLVDRLQYHVHWRLIDLWNNLCIVGSWCLGYEKYTLGPQPQPTVIEAGLTLLGVGTLCLIYLIRRTRAVEIVR